LTENEFWDLAPRDFVELARRRTDDIRREDYRAATIAWAVLAPWTNRRITPGDFLGEERPGHRALTAADRERSQRDFIAAMKAGSRSS
jgi:hypothetical protein